MQKANRTTLSSNPKSLNLGYKYGGKNIFLRQEYLDYRRFTGQICQWDKMMQLYMGSYLGKINCGVGMSFGIIDYYFQKMKGRY